MPIWDKLPNMTYITFEDFVKIPKVVCDYVLQISPMPLVNKLPSYAGNNLVVNEQYVFGGIYHTKENEAHIEQLKHRLAKAEAQNVVAKAQSAHETMEVQERQQFSNAQVQSMEDSLETTHRELAYIHTLTGG